MLDPKGIEDLKVGQMFEEMLLLVQSSDLVFVTLKGIKGSKGWRVVQAIRVQKVMMESVRRPASLAMVHQVSLVCLAPQDPEVCLVQWDPEDRQALRVTWVIWAPLVFLDFWATKENKGLSGNATVPMGSTGILERQDRRVKRGNKAQ